MFFKKYLRHVHLPCGIMDDTEDFSTNGVFPIKRYTKFLLVALLAALGGMGYLLYKSGFFDAVRSIDTLHAYISGFAPYSHLCFFLIQLLSVIFAPIPSNITAAAGGILFGTLPSFLLTFGAVVLGSMCVFLLARALGRPFADQVVSQKISEKYLAVIHAKTSTFLLLAFLFPFFPDDVLCILAGLTPIPALHFFLILLLARPWGLLFASALGGASLSLPIWTMAVFGVLGLVLFYLGMKYGDHVEQQVICWIHNKKEARKKF